jgi:hypothetical protein
LLKQESTKQLGVRTPTQERPHKAGQLGVVAPGLLLPRALKASDRRRELGHVGRC